MHSGSGAGAAPRPSGSGARSRSLLLFAEIRGGKKTNQAAATPPAPTSSSSNRSPPPCLGLEAGFETVRLGRINYKENASGGASVAVNKNKAAGASGSSDSASRVSRAGKPATTAGRGAPVAVRGDAFLPPRRDDGGQTRGGNSQMFFGSCWKTPGSRQTGAEVN